MSQKQRVVFDVSRLKLAEVSVFTDRADVKRKLEFEVQAVGRMEILVERMSPALDENSVRIEGDDAAKIVEVVMKKRSGFEDPVRRAEADELQSILKERIRKDQELSAELNRAKEERAVFETALQYQANQQSFDNLTKFLTRCKEPVKKMDEAISQLQSRFAKTHKEVKGIRSELDHMESGGARWSVLIVLDIVQPSRVEMMLTYAVFGVSWNADYSIKVDSEKRTMQLTYWGLIQQRTGEDWPQVDLRLISAPYGVDCGQVPTLGLWRVFLVEEKKTLARSATCTTPAASSPVASEGPSANTSSQGATAEEGEERSVDVEVESEDGAMSCTFRSFCELIPADGEEYKVVMLTHTQPVEIYYECVPRRAQFAFVKASATNMTGYPLLPGRLLVYLDNSLVASSSFSRIINLRERFDCSLGADPLVCVEYRETGSTFSAAILGFFGRPVTSTTFEQCTIVKNRRRLPIAVKLIDMIPNSADDNVKIILNEPSANLLYKETSGVMHSKEDGCLIRDVFVGAGKEALVVAKYTIQYPAGKSVKLTEKLDG